MGVKLKVLIKGSEIELSSLAGKIIAIDAPNIIMALFNFVYKSQTYSSSNLMTDRTQRVISHLYGLLYRVNFYYSKKIFPIFCFDGRVSELKRVITKDLLNDFRVTKQWYQDAIHSNNKDLASHIAMSKEFLWPNIIDESKKLLGYLGVPCIESPSSAESQCAHLVREEVADYSNSHDFDSLLFGCPYVIQNLSKSLKRKVKGKWIYKKTVPTVYDFKENLRILNITHFQLIDIALLIGTDYFPGIKNIGPKTALELIKTYDDIESIIGYNKEKYDFSMLTDDIIKKVRKIFLLPDVLSSSDHFYWDAPDRSKVIELLCEDHTLNKGRVENNLNKLSNSFYKCCSYSKDKSADSKFTQKTLDELLS